MILVTGATGFIGNHGILNLLNKGIEVLGITRNNNNVNFPSINIDISNKNELTKINPTCVVHTAANIPKSENDFKFSAKINSEIDNNIIEFCREKNLPLIYISSTSIYGITNEMIDEETEPNPENEYAIAKLETEEKISRCLNKYIILRINAPFGKFQRTNNVIKIFINNLLNNRDAIIHGTGNRKQEFTYVTNIAFAIECAINNISKVKGIFNISGGSPISMLNLAQLIKHKLPLTTGNIVFSSQIDCREKENVHFDLNKAKRLLNWEPLLSLEEGLNCFIEDLKNENSNNF